MHWHHPTGRPIGPRTTKSRQAYGESDPADDANYILAGLRDVSSAEAWHRLIPFLKSWGVSWGRGYASGMGNIKERKVQPRLLFSRRTLFALVAFLLLSVLVQVWVLPAAVERAVSLFPEVGPLAAPAILWGVCAVLCWQVIAVIGLQLVRRALENRAGSSTHRWIGAVIGCLLAFAALVAFAFIALNETGYTPPGVMLALVTGGLIALISAGALALFLGSSPSLSVYSQN